jgi:hypothetical protein
MDSVLTMTGERERKRDLMVGNVWYCRRGGGRRRQGQQHVGDMDACRSSGGEHHHRAQPPPAPPEQDRMKECIKMLVLAEQLRDDEGDGPKVAYFQR